MEIQFYKYHGTGNDFILIDNRFEMSDLHSETIIRLCHRNYGIGADGLILLTKREGSDFGMRYFNSDGKESTMCGNGGRCVIAFAKKLGIIKNSAKFFAIDGFHEGFIKNVSDKEEIVKLKMKTVDKIENAGEDYILNTGSPHLVKFVGNINKIDVFKDGRKIQSTNPFKNEGINVTYIQVESSGISVRTYERGVEDETLSCGTGAVAAALATSLRWNDKNEKINVTTRGGKLSVSFEKDGCSFKNIWLEGQAVFVFQGKI